MLLGVLGQTPLGSQYKQLWLENSVFALPCSWKAVSYCRASPHFLTSDVFCPEALHTRTHLVHSYAASLTLERLHFPLYVAIWFKCADAYIFKTAIQYEWGPLCCHYWVSCWSDSPCAAFTEPSRCRHRLMTSRPCQSGFPIFSWFLVANFLWKSIVQSHLDDPLAGWIHPFLCPRAPIH